MKVDLSPIKDQLAVIQQGIRQHFNAMSDETGAWNEVCTYLTKLEMGIAPPITVIAPVVLEPSHNWQSDYKRMFALVISEEGYEHDCWCLHGFHPTKGHCLIGRDYSFDRDAQFGYSVVFKNEVVEFDVPQSLVAWCESQKIWYLDPHNAYTMISDSNE